GVRALIAEAIGGELARVLGLPVPQLVAIDIDVVLARSEPDPEIQATLKASGGINIGLDYLPGALNWEPAMPRVDSALAARIVWFDALISNVDRTAKNPNMLRWHKQVYLIDHGAALYFHHDWPNRAAKARLPFAPIAQHALLPVAGSLLDADAALAPLVTAEALRAILAEVPDDYLTAEATPAATREAYIAYFVERLTAPRAFVEEAERVRIG
ncbi:MAG TPA: HipA family kinase, partial [Kofleriaceae bacterium]|nr:HipA family kinase [Kofleriaceae bacterium]